MLPTLSAALLAAACAGSARPVTVAGPPADIHALAGTWVGDYSSRITGRAGTITFILRATDDSAFGDVQMIPTGAGSPLRPWRDPRSQPAPPTADLTIRFVRVANGRVSGFLAPYADPQTGGRLITSFEGQLAADTISGTYSTRPKSTSEGPTGVWRVVREPH